MVAGGKIEKENREVSWTEINLNLYSDHPSLYNVLYFSSNNEEDCFTSYVGLDDDDLSNTFMKHAKQPCFTVGKINPRFM